MPKPHFAIVGALCLLSLIGPALPTTAQAQPGNEPTATMPVDEVKVGMKGYGLTVFHGDAIEPFNVEVVSVVGNSSAGLATVWVNCTDERMVRSGPVKGMSGSPIYLWEEGQQGTIGEGGRLIGAFAFGYGNSNVCLVGVQPIAYMREAGRRAVEEDLASRPGRSVSPDAARQTVARLQDAAAQRGLSGPNTLTLDAVGALWAGRSPHAYALPPALSATREDRQGPRPLMLPLSVGTADAADLLAPLLAPSGIDVMADQLPQGSITSAAPPSNVQPDRVHLEPGSVLSIPLAYGDLDLCAAGTVTDVLPDGTVLAFGHAMNAIGSARLPMATGYTHFVVSRDSVSFKQAGSLDIVGSIVRDEATAVAGRPEMAFSAAPLKVTVQLPQQPERSYNYHVVNDPQLTPAIVGAVVMQSLTAVQSVPLLHTMHVTGSFTYSGDRTVTYESTLPGAGPTGLAFSMIPIIASFSQNPFEAVDLVSAEVSVTVDEGVTRYELESAALDRQTAAPGDTVNISTVLRPQLAPPVTRRVAFTLPTDLPDGDYQLMITDAGGYTERMMLSDPELADVTDLDDLQQSLQRLLDVDSSALYVGLPRQKPGVAVDGEALPNLPSSRMAVLSATASTRTSPFPQFVEQQYDLDAPLSGQLTLTLHVQATP